MFWLSGFVVKYNDGKAVAWSVPGFDKAWNMK